MAKRYSSDNHAKISAQPRLHQSAPEIQAYGTVSHLLPLELEEPVRLEMTERLNQLLADTITLRDLYKKSHWQVAGPTFYQLHLLFDKHFSEQTELVDGRGEPGDGAGRRGNHAHCPASSRPGGGSGAAFTTARYAPDYCSGLP